MTLGQGQEKTLTFNTHITILTQLVVCIFKLSGHRLQQFLKIPQLSLFRREKPKLPNLSLPYKIGQGQPRVTMYINFVELESLILQAKF